MLLFEFVMVSVLFYAYLVPASDIITVTTLVLAFIYAMYANETLIVTKTHAVRRVIV